ncbi:MAG: DUF2452 domain-containing protein [Polyangiaceae bacterium]
MTSDDKRDAPGSTTPSTPEPALELHRTSASPYPISRLSARIELLDVAREIQEADAMLGAVVGGQLDVIAHQIRVLQEQARAILDKAKLSQDLHRADCRFKKRPGAVYHLYRRSNGSLYFSMLSPEEWGGRPPHSFEGSFRLEADMSYVRVDPH